MKTRELDEIRHLDLHEMNNKLMDLKSELFNLRFQLAVGQLENSMRIREVKKSIAQVKTVIREEEIKQLR
ncbi:50S ribosomal protein L29 [Candidatus Arthromitus sp. SFB-turkey]|uniref:50S ribosomal protein L29 n=1 Tax=Candidatus Arthromitus sp. SFB-turkey TaxID=1840217 RepID=UPI0007F51EFC|nr:50S ribosomal protein L29 [Candidatus Arthromitus sp. SFB-turkey]OAT88846.1 50S ribosomal protein L29 [Candidatus Arthromitus sp. SFB-turkey]